MNKPTDLDPLYPEKPVHPAWYYVGVAIAAGFFALMGKLVAERLS